MSFSFIQNDRLVFVLGQQIGRSEVRLEMINEYVTGILPSFLDQDEDRALQHPMLNTSTFSTYTKVMSLRFLPIYFPYYECFLSIKFVLDIQSIRYSISNWRRLRRSSKRTTLTNRILH